MSEEVKPEETTGPVEAVERPDAVTLPFEFEGESYTFNKDVFSDLDFREAVEDEKDITVVKLLVGRANFLKFKAGGKNGKRSMEELQRFGTAAYNALGVSLGESKG